MKVLAVLLSLFAVGHCHLCLLSPPQRGSMSGINTPAANDCILTTGPCGGRQPGRDATFYGRGENITVTFMKNLDHYNKTNPGKFVISLSERQTVAPKVLATVPDAGEPSLHIYSVKVMAPREPPNTMHFLQVTYEPNNAQAPKAFYQCSDVGFEPRP
ncbi:uncharacterized protein LOC128187678 [Crassostrea angulata]|uniref:uncharacterized protein LOC128187678 n=1 Tax=Magallana angulata TaxID=2784310 RepID=UPI0022B2166C|nr:uncharacterized protein LOC128187678 [Crassostrea angulata]